jgi:uncharacterized repeat protein (TIGR03803 family)
MTTNGNVTALVSFGDYDDSGNESTNGWSPDRLMLGSDDNFYGTTSRNGFGNSGGTFFRMTPSGALTTLGTFNSRGNPAWFVQGADSRFYVTAAGTEYRIAPLAALATLKGISSLGNLIQGKDGNFYGTTCNGAGTIFRMTPKGAFTNLVVFDANKGNYGRRPVAGLVQGRDGYLYGTTFAGDTNAPPTNVFNPHLGRPVVALADPASIAHTKPDLGTIFRVGVEGKLTTLVAFKGTNGSHPIAKLVQGADGSFYGMTTDCDRGLGGCSGTVFRLGVLH